MDDLTMDDGLGIVDEPSVVPFNQADQPPVVGIPQGITPPDPDAPGPDFGVSETQGFHDTVVGTPDTIGQDAEPFFIF